MSGSVYPCDKCGKQNWVNNINDQGLCKKCANINILAPWLWAVAIIAVVLFTLFAHPHYGNCYQGDMGWTCSLTHYTFGWEGWKH